MSYPFRRRRHKSDWVVNLMAASLVVAGVLAFIVALTLLFALPVWLAWNLGVVGMSHAAGGHIHHISLWVALGASLVIGTLSRIFRPQRSVYGSGTST